uniref:Putative NAC domain class transcription factor n=1 Tax=Tamarix hispida TaxID=189793 RepID=T2CB69_9CARY|nr:putative NAC domain class transcription factor [Tamarix hispida]
MVPGQSPAADVFAADDLHDQSLLVEFPSENAPAALKICQEDSGSNVDDSRSLSSNDQKPMVGATVCENQRYSALSDDQFFTLSMQPELETDTGKNEYFIDANNVVDHTSTGYLPVHPSMDIVNNSQAIDNAPCGDGLFLEANDLLPPAENDPSYFGDKFDELLALMEQENNIEQYFDFDSLEPMANDFTIAEDAFFGKENLYNEAEPVPLASQQLPAAYSDDASSSKPVVEVQKSKRDLVYPFINRMLGNIPAPPAFAAEFPAKNVAARLNAASDSVRVTTGMVRIKNTTASGNGMQWFLGKDGIVNVVLSFAVPESVVSPVGLKYLSGVLGGKAASAVSRGWFYFLFFWVLVLAITAKIGTCIYAK